MRTWKRFAAGLVAVAAFAVPGAASADHCNGDVTSIPGEDGAVLYLDNRGGTDLWLYAETNNEPGLQSGGKHVLGNDVDFFDYSDGCNHENPDTLLY